MDDQEETLVLNYLDETPVETEAASDVTPNLDENSNENQNPKVDIKEEIIKTTPQKNKNLLVYLENMDLTPKTLKYSTSVRNRERISTSCDSTIPVVTKRKRGRPSAESKKPSIIQHNGFKTGGLKVLKRAESQSLSQKKLFSSKPKSVKTSQNCDANDNIADPVIKVENVEENILETPIISTDLNFNRQIEDIDVKYEGVEQIHTEFKYESVSDTEEITRKKKQAINTVLKRKKSLKIPPKLEAMQSTLDNFLKVVNLKSQSKPINNFFKCDLCLYVGNSKANLERHGLIHMNPKDILWYKCTECDYKSKYEHQLKSHTLIHKNPDEIYYFQCPHCELKCSRKHNLANHIRSIHVDRINSLKCAECNYSTFSKDRLVAHVKKHSREVFTCSLCKFVTKRKSYLESHFKLKHTEVNRPFPCDTCSYKGKTKRELDRHYDRMHNKEKLHTYLCNHCKFTSIYKKNLEFHLLHMHQNSEGFQKFICGHCEKEFAYKNGLKTHIIRIHLKLTEDDWQKCQECKYKCKDVNTLKRHIKRNHGAPRLRCNLCSFATNRQKSMIAHMKTHEADADDILKCPECPYRIIQAVSFVYHMKVLHGKPIGSKDIPKYYLKDD